MVPREPECDMDDRVSQTRAIASFIKVARLTPADGMDQVVHPSDLARAKAASGPLSGLMVARVRIADGPRVRT